MNKSDKIFVAGSGTLIGGALTVLLRGQGYTGLVGPTGPGLDLTDPAAVDEFFAAHRPEYVFMAAGLSGGIGANQDFPADLMVNNLLVAANVIQSAHRHKARRLLYLASSCSYPRECPQPMRPEHLFTGPLEPTNEAYAVAKLAGLTLCQAFVRQYGDDFITAIPANAFGPGDDFSPANSHVVAALLRRMHEAKESGLDEVVIWGSGSPRREFIFAPDLADAAVYVMTHYQFATPINLGCGWDYSIADLADRIREVVGFQGRLRYDTSKPDGMPVKTLDSKPLRKLGWRPETTISQALETTYRWWLANKDRI